MDNQGQDNQNQGVPGGVVPPVNPVANDPFYGSAASTPPIDPIGGSGLSNQGEALVLGAESTEDKILAALKRIEEKLTAIAAKLGA